MADHKAARDRCDAFIRDQTEQVRPEELPAQEECPICLNTYEEETPVRIKMDGCSHVIGRNCLSAILTNSPRLEKKCPLCRTKWMDAPANTAANNVSAVRDIMASMGMPPHLRAPYGAGIPPDWPGPRIMSEAPRLGRVAPLISGATNSQGGGGRGRGNGEPPTPLTFGRTDTQGRGRGRGVGEPPTPRRSSGRIINLIESDEEEDPLQSFHSITRDINSVRERARNTQSSRKQRKENKKKPDASFARYRRPTISEGSNNESNPRRRHAQQAQPVQPDSPSFFPTIPANFPPSRRPSRWDLVSPSPYNRGLSNSSTEVNTGTEQLVQSVTTPEDAMAVDEPNARAPNFEPSSPHFEPNSPQFEPRSPNFESSSPLATIEELRVRGSSSPDTVAPMICGNPPVRTSSLGNTHHSNMLQRRNAHQGPFVLSPSPESESGRSDVERFLDAVAAETANNTQPETNRTLEQQLDQRERDLDRREGDLGQRERRVDQREREQNVREHRIDQREAALRVREHALAQREQRMTLQEDANTRLAQRRSRQLNEMTNMIARHRMELENMP